MCSHHCVDFEGHTDPWQVEKHITFIFKFNMLCLFLIVVFYIIRCFRRMSFQALDSSQGRSSTLMVVGSIMHSIVMHIYGFVGVEISRP
jgi:hypothetical protein